MYGLEKKEQAAFEFDLEKELQQNPERVKELLLLAETKTQELKNLLREGAGSADFDQLGILLQGFHALQKVINKSARKK